MALWATYLQCTLSPNWLKMFSRVPPWLATSTCVERPRDLHLFVFSWEKNNSNVYSRKSVNVYVAFSQNCVLFFFISGQATLFLIVIAVVPKPAGGLWACWPTGDSCSCNLCLSRKSSQMVFFSSLIVLLLTLLFLATGFDGSVLVLLRNPVSHKTPTDLSKKKNIRVVCVYVCPCSSVQPFWSIPVILPWLCFDFPFSSVNSLQF